MKMFSDTELEPFPAIWFAGAGAEPASWFAGPGTSLLIRWSRVKRGGSRTLLICHAERKKYTEKGLQVQLSKWKREREKKEEIKNVFAPNVKTWNTCGWQLCANSGLCNANMKLKTTAVCEQFFLKYRVPGTVLKNSLIYSYRYGTGTTFFK